MKRFISVALTGIAILLVTVVTAMVALRVAIHGREVAVPDLAGLSDSDATAAARRLGLNLSVENRFYSAAVAANHVLSQAPAAGSRVRRGWQMRVTESLGGQHVAAPDLIGESERPASLMLSRLQLTLGPEVHLPAPGPTGVVLAQSPSANASDATGPQVALLISAPEPDSANFAYVMPRITGMSLAAANEFLSTAGLHLTSPAEEGAEPTAKPSNQSGAQEPAAQNSTVTASGNMPQNPMTAPEPTPLDLAAIIATQSPAPGHRVTPADMIRVTVVHEAEGSALPAPL